MKKILFALTVLFLIPFTVRATESNLQDIIQNGTVTLQDDYEITQSVNIANDMNVILDLNGHNIIITGAGKDAIANHGTLTIKGEGLISSQAAAITNYPGATAILDNGTYKSTGWYTIKNMGHMTINNFEFGNNLYTGASLVDNGFVGSKASDRGELEANYNDDTVLMTINGGTFSNQNNSCNVIKNDDLGNLVINGGKFISGSNSETNSNPVVQNWHRATINDGEFTSLHGAVLTNGFWDATVGVGELIVNGGTYTGERGILAYNTDATNGKGFLKINGGTFNGEMSDNPKYEVIINGGIFSDDTVVPSEESGLQAFEIIGLDKVIIASEDDLVNNLESELIKESDLDATTLNIIKAALKDNQKIAGYYDINYFKSVGGYNVEQIENAPDKVKVTIKLPDNLAKLSEGYTRTFYVVRVHDGKTDILAATLNKDGTISFETDKFSTYAIAYTDTKKAETTVENPKTLDATAAYVALLGLSIAGAFVSYNYMKKNKANS